MICPHMEKIINMKNTTVNRTTITLYKTLLNLLEKKSFEDITVNDICEEAMVSRSTFYSYFDDKYALVTFSLNRERESLEIVAGENIEENLLKLLYRLKEKKIVYKNLLLAQTNRELNRMIIDHISSFVVGAFDDGIDEVELSITTTFYSTGIAGIVIWWIEKNFPISEGELAKYIFKIIK